MREAVREVLEALGWVLIAGAKGLGTFLVSVPVAAGVLILSPYFVGRIVRRRKVERDEIVDLAAAIKPKPEEVARVVRAARIMAAARWN